MTEADSTKVMNLQNTTTNNRPIICLKYLGSCLLNSQIVTIPSSVVMLEDTIWKNNYKAAKHMCNFQGHNNGVGLNVNVDVDGRPLPWCKSKLLSFDPISNFKKRNISHYESNIFENSAIDTRSTFSTIPDLIPMPMSMPTTSIIPMMPMIPIQNLNEPILIDIILDNVEHKYMKYDEIMKHIHDKLVPVMSVIQLSSKCNVNPLSTSSTSSTSSTLPTNTLLTSNILYSKEIIGIMQRLTSHIQYIKENIFMNQSL